MNQNHTKTAFMAARQKLNDGLLSMLPGFFIRLICTLPLLFLWQAIADSGSAGMSLDSMRTYTYATILLSEQLNVRTFARELSLGQRLRADIAMLLLHEPELILLDEPTLGLDVTAKRQMIRFLKTANREKGVTVMVTSHDMDDLEEMADRILMIAKGKIVYDGSFDGLRNLAGDAVRIAVTTGKGKTLPHLPMTLLGEQNGVFEYEADTAALPLPALLRTLSEIDGIQSVEIRKSPIEQVIDSLYQNWK